ncbi:hypothetical protein T01_9277 [Trichinella spiralis]|uniref:Uncharacterized protein n=1 Tax=Trichinella spiralis TaxID=6334 RepID=A0A0V1AK19_TRISP|nr:hypothetical protein T01_9277 [Trichinella spiralis]
MAFCYVHFVPFKSGKRSNYSLHCVIWSIWCFTSRNTL